MRETFALQSAFRASKLHPATLGDLPHASGRVEQESRAESAEQLRKESVILVNLSSYGWCLPIPCSALPSTTRTTQGKGVSHWHPSRQQVWEVGTWDEAPPPPKDQLLGTPVGFLGGTKKLWRAKETKIPPVFSK